MPLKSHEQLAALLKKRIKETGGIKISEYMREALTNPLYGYYKNKDPLGEGGDFITAPEISQIFGELIGAYVAYHWQVNKFPRMTIVEAGPGKGTLMKDLLRATKNIPLFHQNIDIILIETSNKLKEVQDKNLGGFGVDIFWQDDFSNLPANHTIFIANEFFDALPIRQFVKKTTGWVERLVGYERRRKFMFVEGEEKLSFKQHENAPAGAILEVSKETESCMQVICSHIKKHGGTGVVIDYGYDKYDYANTLQAVKDHRKYKALREPGLVDITAHVDFIKLKEIVEKNGLKTPGIFTQKDFLLSMGILERADLLKKQASKEQGKIIGNGVKRLIADHEMGILFKVLTFER